MPCRVLSAVLHSLARVWQGKKESSCKWGWKKNVFSHSRLAKISLLCFVTLFSFDVRRWVSNILIAHCECDNRLPGEDRLFWFSTILWSWKNSLFCSALFSRLLTCALSNRSVSFFAYSIPVSVFFPCILPRVNARGLSAELCYQVCFCGTSY